MNESIRALWAESLGQRLVLSTLAVAGSAAYAMSFLLVEEGRDAVSAAVAVGLAAGVAWIVFGLALLLVTRVHPSLVAWVDLCLATMAVGIAVLTASVVLNLVGVWVPEAHIAVVVASDVSMAAVFAFRARRLGLGAGRALGLWVVVLNGTFATILWVLL